MNRFRGSTVSQTLRTPDKRDKFHKNPAIFFQIKLWMDVLRFSINYNVFLSRVLDLKSLLVCVKFLNIPQLPALSL